MKLRRLNLSGFKTFARRSEIVFDHGITAIVGPNGSGKSNVVDAVRWALGETNARELRGAKMDEVIYSGGRKRARMNFADVELVLDNEDGRIAIEGAEVAVSRRVTRNGDSEFRLNGDRVRLRDIERALGATGLTQTGYSVVAQNDIDGIIQATPSQRRALVEQAAGVRSLRAASEDALDKIGKAEVTLRRLDDLLDDAEPRLAELAEQAELALEQQALSERLAELRGSLAREEWRAARAQLRQARRRLDAALSRADAAAEAEAGFNARFDTQREAVAAAREAQRESLQQLEDARLAAERAAGDARRWADRQTAAVLQRSIARGEAGLAAATCADVDRTLGELAASGVDVEAEASAAARHLAEAQAGHDARVAAAAGNEAALADAEAALELCGAEWTRAADARRDAAARVEVIVEAINALGGEATAVRDRVALLNLEMNALEVRAAAAAADRAGAEAAEVGAQASLGARRAECRDAEADLTRLREVTQATIARAAMLRGQIDGALGGRGAISDAVDAGNLKATRLIDCLRAIDPRDGAAIEAALETHLGAWLTDDLDAAAALLVDNPGREEVITASAVALPAAPAPAGTRRALEAITLLRDGARGPLDHILGEVWLAPDMATARRAVTDLGGRAVLPDGRVVSSIGVRGGGVPGRTLELAAEERAAAAAAAAAITSERLGADQLRSAEADVEAAQEHATAAAATTQTARIHAAESDVLLGNARKAGDSESQRLLTLEAAQQARDSELRNAETTAAAAAAAALHADTALAAARQGIDTVRAAVAEQRAAMEASVAAVRQAEAAAGQADLLSDDLSRRLSAARHAGEAANARHHHAELRVLATEGDALAAVVRSQRARAAAAAVSADVAAARTRVEATGPALGEAERGLAAVDVERSEVAIAVARAGDERGAAAIEVATAEARVADLADAVRGDDEDEGPEPDAQAAEKAEREIVRLERRVSALGPVNGLAPAQHAVLAVRVQTLRSSRDDIGIAATDVRAMVAQLSTEIEERFDAVFGAVCVHFQELFEELFPGGKATLRLEPAAPVDNGAAEGLPVDDDARAVRPAKLPGVEILAQPAGKRLQPLSLLSGGERALTALAVILALQQVNASPFYIFDEIDAPLDDANIKRLCRLLQRLSSDQQFIVVTHNHVTMAAADVLYGVTIDGDGVSSVLSVRLAAAEELAEVTVAGRVQPTVPATAPV